MPTKLDKQHIEYVIQNTKLSNQRTYLAYMRTGFAIAALAGAFKKLWVALFGIIMILGSTIQYLYINYQLELHKNPSNSTLDMVPIIYVPVALAAIYLQMNNSILNIQY